MVEVELVALVDLDGIPASVPPPETLVDDHSAACKSSTVYEKVDPVVILQFPGFLITVNGAARDDGEALSVVSTERVATPVAGDVEVMGTVTATYTGEFSVDLIPMLDDREKFEQVNPSGGPVSVALTGMKDGTEKLRTPLTGGECPTVFLALGDGITRSFVPEFQVLRDTHYRVRVDGVEVSEWFAETGVVTLLSAPALDAVIEIRRATPPEPMVVFTDSSDVRAEELALLFQQLAYYEAETRDERLCPS